MKRIALLLILLSSLPLCAQIVHRNDIILNKQNKPVAGAKVYFCKQPAVGAPCTNPITLYTDLTGSTPLSQGYVVTDANGNFDLYAESQWVTMQLIYGYAVPLVTTDYGLFQVGGPLDFSFDLLTPNTGDSGTYQHAVNQKVALTRISCDTDQGAALIDLDVRVPGAPNTPGTQAMSNPLSCSPLVEAVGTSFVTGIIPSGSPLALIISSTSGSPGIVRVHVSLIAQ